MILDSEKGRKYDICGYDEGFKYKIGQIINDNVVLEYIKYKDNRGVHTKRGFICKCIRDGYIRPIEQYKLNNGIHGCAVCDNKLVIEGVNDIATTRPDLVIYLNDKSIIHRITRASDKEIDLECPVCHTIKKGKVKDLAKRGFSCPKCSDGRTIPNKLMYLILEKNEIKFECEVKFDWCRFPVYQKKNITYGVYDFVIEDKKLIIEMDGGLGHGKKSHSHSKKTAEETLYRDNMKDKLAFEHGYKVIRIDCDYTEDNKFDYLYNSLYHSDISNYIDIRKIDLKTLFIEANSTSLVKESCELWNQGMSLGEISQKIKFGKVTVRKYLKIGTAIGLCKYNDSVSYDRGKRKFSNGVYEYSLHFNSAEDFSDFLEMYNIPLNFNTIKNRFVSGNTNQTVIDNIRIERKKLKE